LRKKTLEESEKTTYRITRPMMSNDSVSMLRPMEHRIEEVLNKEEEEEHKVERSKSKFMENIGKELKYVGLRSLKNLNII
jgi:DNA-binding protein H-NS